MKGGDIDQDMLDGKLIKIFPFLVVLFALSGIVAIFIPPRAADLGMLLLRFCATFVIAFFIMGTALFLYTHSHRSHNHRIMAILIIAPIVVAILFQEIGMNLLPELYMSLLFTDSGNMFFDIAMTSVKMYGIMVMLLMASYGVTFVVAAYFRQKIAKLYRYISNLKNDGTDDRAGRFTLGFYDVPDIIDIKDVEMEPVVHKSFPMDAFLSMMLSIFALSVMISSYIFLNPMFTSGMTIYHTLMIGVVMSIFIPALVMPWFITKETGTKIISDSRPYYLWKGMKKRTYQSFFAVSILFFLLLLSLYMESDVLRITVTYMGFVVFAGLMSLIYSYIYFSRFNENIKETIIKKFEE